MLQSKLCATLLFTSLIFIAASSPKLKQVALVSGKVSLQIPSGIIIKETHTNMDAMDGFTDTDKTMHFSYIVFGSMGGKKIKDGMSAMEQEFVTRPKHKLISKGLKSINGNDVAYFYIETKEEYKNNIVFATDVAGEFVAFVYASNTTDIKEWNEVSMQILNSLKIN